MNNGKKMMKLVAVVQYGPENNRKSKWTTIGVAFENRVLQPPLRLPADGHDRHHHPDARLRSADRRGRAAVELGTRIASRRARATSSRPSVRFSMRRGVALTCTGPSTRDASDSSPWRGDYEPAFGRAVPLPACPFGAAVVATEITG